MNQNKQPEALRFSVESEMSRAFEIECGKSWTDPDWRREAGIWASAWHKATNAELRRLHAESELHMQELRSYRITVENREARIVELEKQLAAAQQARVPLSDELPQGFLSDVLTAAGLVSHGKQCKALGSRIGEAVEAIWKISIQQRESISAHGIKQEKQG